MPDNSPLRMILENEGRYKLLASAAKAYFKQPDQVVYAHGIAVAPQGQGYGTLLHKERLRMFVGEEDIMVSFILANPLNVPSLRMHLKQGGIADKIETNVYEQGVHYFRVIQNRNIVFQKGSERKIKLEGDYLKSINDSMAEGFVISAYLRPSSVVLRRKQS